jgi:hypothetical protein
MTLPSSLSHDNRGGLLLLMRKAVSIRPAGKLRKLCVVTYGVGVGRKEFGDYFIFNFIHCDADADNVPPDSRAPTISTQFVIPLL